MTAGPAPPVEIPTQRSRHRVLLAGHLRPLRRAYTHVLLGHGYDVSSAVDGARGAGDDGRRLPRRRVDDAAGTPALRPAPSGRGVTVSRARVLVVEDLPALRRAYREVLERAGHDVSVASNGGAALAMLDVIRPDVVVAEVSMPVMDGITMLRAMRQRGMPARVLMLADDEFLRGLALHVGAEQFLAQPITPRDLLDAVALLARSQPAARRDSA